MKQGKIRPLALCVFRRGDRILVAENYDPTKRQTFYRPLGGGIQFGERGAEAIEREIREELGAELRDVRYLGMLENVFTFDGAPGHELVLVYDATFADPSLYHQEELRGWEGKEAFTAVWQPLSRFPNAETPLYPDGLLELLTAGGGDVPR